MRQTGGRPSASLFGDPNGHMLLSYDIPNWLLGILVVTVCMVVSLGGHALVQRFWIT